MKRKSYAQHDQRFAMAFLVVVVFLVANIYMSYSIQQEIDRLASRLSKTSPTIHMPSNATWKVVETEIPVVAVSSDGRGVVGKLKVKVMPGNNNVFIATNPFSEADIQYSLNKAVAVAKQYTGKGYGMDYIFSFDMPETGLIGGESAGAAATVATIAAIENKDIRNDSVITGTIEVDGSIGRIGGVIEKAKAVADSGYSYFLIPKGQGKITYYERVSERKEYGYYEILTTRYVPRKFDLIDAARKEWGLTIKEVSSIDEAVKHFLGQS